MDCNWVDKWRLTVGFLIKSDFAPIKHFHPAPSMSTCWLGRKSSGVDGGRFEAVCFTDRPRLIGDWQQPRRFHCQVNWAEATPTTPPPEAWNRGESWCGCCLAWHKTTKTSIAKLCNLFLLLFGLLFTRQRSHGKQNKLGLCSRGPIMKNWQKLTTCASLHVLAFPVLLFWNEPFRFC